MAENRFKQLVRQHMLHHERCTEDTDDTMCAIMVECVVGGSDDDSKGDGGGKMG